MEAGTEDSSLVAIATASWVMLAPCFLGVVRSAVSEELLGWTEKTNSMVPRTPPGLSGTRVRVRMRGCDSHGGSTFGLTRAFNAGIRTQVSVLNGRQTSEGASGWATYLSTSSLYAVSPASREASSSDGSKAFFAASTSSWTTLG